MISSTCTTCHEVVYLSKEAVWTHYSGRDDHVPTLTDRVNTYG